MEGTGESRAGFDLATKDIPPASALDGIDFAHLASLVDPASNLGAPQSWPAPLLVALRSALASRQPVLVFWGPDSRLFCNGVARDLLAGDIGTRALGLPAAELLRSWPGLAPQIAAILRGEAVERGGLVVRGGPAASERCLACSHAPIVDPAAPRGVGGALTLIDAGDAASRLTEMFEQTPGFACMLRGPDHVFDLANESYRLLVGDRPLIGRPLREALPEIASQGFLDLLDAVRTQGRRHVARRQRVLLRRDGETLEEVFVDFVYEPVRGADGSVSGVFVQGGDVTDQVRGEERWRAIVEAAPGLVFAADADGAIHFVNEQACAQSGRDAAALRGRRWFDLLHPDDAQAALRLWREAQVLCQPFEAECRFRGRDGADWRWHLARVAPMRVANGAAAEWVGVATDIHERREAEQRLAANVDAFDRLITGNPFGIYVVDGDFRIAYASEGAKRTFGSALAPLIGKELGHAMRTIWPEPFASEAVLRFRRAMDLGETYVARDTFERRADRDAKEAYDWHVERIVMPDGRFGVVCYFHDLTERVAYEEKLKASARALAENETRLRLATEHAEIGFWDVDPMNDVLVWPPRVKAMFGVSADAPVTMRADFYACLHPDDRDRVSAAYAAACDPRRRALYDVEYRTVGKEDGVLRWVAAKGRGVFDAQGRCVRVIGTAIDITARKRVEEQLRETSERVQLALDAGAIIGVWDWNLPRDRLTADARFAEAFGLDPERCRAGIGLDEAVANIHPADRSAVMAAVDEAIRSGGAFARQYRVRGADGAYHWVEANGRVDRGPDGTPMRFPGVLLDIEARRAVEAERDQVKARLAALMDAIPGVVYCKDREGRMVFANRGATDLIGKPLLACLGRTDADLLGDRAQAQAVMANDQNVMMSGTTATFEEEVSSPDGRRSIWFSTKAPFRDASGEVVGLIGASIDITDRKRAEQEILDSQARLRAALEAGKMGEYSLDLATGEITAAPRTRELFGFGDDAPRGIDDWLARTHPEDRIDLRQNLLKAAGSDASDSQNEFRVTHPAGVRWIAAHNEIVRGPHGAPIAVRGLIYDVTARRLNEERLRDLNADLERRVAEALEGRRLWSDIIEANDAFIQAITPDFRLLAINRANADEYVRVFGKRPRVGDSLLEILAEWPEQLASSMAIWSRALNGEIVVETGEYGDDALEKRWYEMKFSPLRHPDGRLMGALHISYEVTQKIRQQEALAKAQAELFEAQKMETIGQLTGGVAHDFNNLLAAILTNLDLAKKRIPDLRTATLIEGAVKGAERGAALSKRLLAFARRQELNVATVDVAALFDDMLDLLSRSLGPSIRIDTDFPARLPPVRVDANQLELALLNLAVNARDAMPGGGTLSVSAAALAAEANAPDLAAGDYVRIRIVDTGGGMDAETLRKATEPFFTTKGVGKGTGLGLSMVQGLAAQSGGALRLHSEIGRGATVDLWLPQAPAGMQPAAAAAPSLDADADEGAPMKILVVDDDALVAMGTVAMLEDLGHAVFEANSGRKALDVVDQHPDFDLVITDHAMPGMTGCELAGKLQSLRPDLPIILATGYAELPAGRDPGLPRLAKPFRQDELIAALRSARRPA
ncbi:PAS domain S-box-containing protein [Rhodoblastus acidophilus]|uniref:PAS domain-containing protein n=1 Tax=Rhodoblastus acidophilus TaxID=1074 RepID=UPI002224FFA8|nr:PAS domain-containing protein [Rhodoblastus acidophilus]MCW2317331.1 PAS domain S-box-containing protein [Rhodoblastus acidophilus]